MRRWKVRKEFDSLGSVEVPKEAYYGAFTARAISNFPPSKSMHQELIRAMADVKWACAETNLDFGLLTSSMAKAIEMSCDEIKDGKLDKWIVVDPLSGGAGTAVNMNFNEIMANRATELLGGKLGEYLVHPLDHVNRSQSTNDVYPSAVKIGMIRLLRKLVDKVIDLQDSLQKKEKEFAGMLKVGRTELQDAVPITLGQEFGAWAEAIARDRWRLYKVEERIRFINLGATAIGTGINAPKNYSFKVTRKLSERVGIGLVKSENLIEATQNTDVFAEVHGLLKTLATNIIKISNDMRILSSGPHAGIGEMRLKPVQPGSSIMPGKVNPVLLEYAIQLSIKVISNDVAINFAVSSGNLELNAFLPLIQWTLYESSDLLIQTADALKRCVEGVEGMERRCLDNLNRSTTLATCFVPTLGYEKVAEIVKKADETGVSVKSILVEYGIPRKVVESVMDPKKMIALGYTGEQLKNNSRTDHQISPP